MTTAQTTFAVDSVTLQAIDELKDVFGVKTNAQVIRKALALARVAAKKADSQTHSVMIGSPEKGETEVMLVG